MQAPKDKKDAKIRGGREEGGREDRKIKRLSEASKQAYESREPRVRSTKAPRSHQGGVSNRAVEAEGPYPMKGLRASRSPRRRTQGSLQQGPCHGCHAGGSRSTIRNKAPTTGVFQVPAPVAAPGASPPRLTPLSWSVFDHATFSCRDSAPVCKDLATTP